MGAHAMSVNHRAQLACSCGHALPDRHSNKHGEGCLDCPCPNNAAGQGPMRRTMRAFTAKGGQDGIEVLNAFELEAERGPEVAES